MNRSATPAPYLSIVAAARNDDHGGNLLGRLQTFVNALLDQARGHDLPVELVLVEWNPPSDRPPLSQALRWPADPAPATVRIITVPAAVHARFRYADGLPLYQMIAKNVGIRRSRGEFILATNIDILFSDELMRFVASRGLELHRMYRIDRHDAEAGVPVDATVAGRLEYCRSHLLRVNAREGTFAVTPDARRRLCAQDIVPAGAGISFGQGWYLPQQHGGELSRLLAGRAEVLVHAASTPRCLEMELAPLPGVPFRSLALADAHTGKLGEATLSGRSVVRVPVRPGASEMCLVSGDPLTVAWRVYHCRWASGPFAEETSMLVSAPRRHPIRRALRLGRAVSSVARNWGRGGETGRVGLPIPAAIRERFGVNQGEAYFTLRKSAVTLPALPLSPPPLHTNACGDFTLAHRNHWFDVRGYPEFDLYSMNIDSLLCFTMRHAGAVEHQFAEPMRIYHIEHSSGSGWTPEGQDGLYRRLAAKGIPWLPYETVAQWAAQMTALDSAMIFNREQWGLNDLDLPDARIPDSAGRVV